MYEPEEECNHQYSSGQCELCGANFMEETDEPVVNFTGGTAVRNPSLTTRVAKVIKQLEKIGTIPTEASNHLTKNIGTSNYAQHIIQPWAIILDWNLDYWDGDIVKRTLRTKTGQSRIEDYKKIIHICEERIRQLKT